MTLSLTKVAQALLEDNPGYKLVRYINQVQQFELRHLDYDAAAEAIGVSVRTVGRLVKKLEEKRVLIVDEDRKQLRINEDLKKTG